jgi:hypothetical protein
MGIEKNIIQDDKKARPDAENKLGLSVPYNGTTVLNHRTLRHFFYWKAMGISHKGTHLLLMKHAC